jgi:hypothetical protein
VLGRWEVLGGDGGVIPICVDDDDREAGLDLVSKRGGGRCSGPCGGGGPTRRRTDPCGRGGGWIHAGTGGRNDPTVE